MAQKHSYWESQFTEADEVYIGVGPNVTSARAKARSIYLDREGGPPPSEIVWTDTEKWGPARTDTP